jgi:hypothetical protein
MFDIGPGQRRMTFGQLEDRPLALKGPLAGDLVIESGRIASVGVVPRETLSTGVYGFATGDLF